VGAGLALRLAGIGRLSTERLERVDRVMKDYVDRGRVAGVVTLIARRGKVAHLQS
jgi:hypothetical protein